MTPLIEVYIGRALEDTRRPKRIRRALLRALALRLAWSFGRARGEREGAERYE